MEVLTSPGGAVAVVAPEGELDLATVPGLRTCLHEAHAGKAQLVVVDLRLVTFADSTLMAVLVAASRRLAESGRRLLVVNAQGLPLRVLKLTGLTSVIDVRQPGEVLGDELRVLLNE